MPHGSLKVLNWNIGGAKYLQLKSSQSPNYSSKQISRELFRERLNAVLVDLIEKNVPDVVTLQEVVRYDENGDKARAQHVIDVPDDYEYFPLWLIDTQHHSHQGKWDKVREIGEWTDDAFYAQGNAILIRKNIPYFPIYGLPAVGQRHSTSVIRDRIEVVKLESGLYFGDRNTEPRAALVAHLVLDQLTDEHGNSQELQRPLDIFVINLHLTTLMFEREGVPDIDDEAAQTRLRQLGIVLDGIVSRYNKWRKDKFKIRGKEVRPRACETHERHAPIWIITGDFNFTPESVEYLTLVRKGFIDLLPSHHLGTKASGLGNRPTLTLDYVFAGPKFEAIDPGFAEQGITGNHVQWDKSTAISDHFPLIVDVPIALAAP
jgi:endonuclease/exonuclease/phosphatase family metal-dependent hydrolase